MKLAMIVVLTALITATSTIVLADCAWILWHDLQVILPGDSSSKEWTVVGTAKTFEECVELQEKALADHFTRLKNKNDNISGAEETILRGGPRIVTSNKNGKIEIRYSCWPESRDPRH
jgi:predicted tellurium resistance membrane protein TerC